MALAEARAAWQRTANRCLVQEDAKRAPKFACCPSVNPSFKHSENEPVNADNGRDIPTTFSVPFNRNPSCSNSSPSSRWWLQTQPSYGYRQVESKFAPSVESQNLELLRECSVEVDEPSVCSCDFSESAEVFCFESEKSVPWWRSVDTEELALLVAQRSTEVLENCDLPRPQNARVKENVGMDMPYFVHSENYTRDPTQGCEVGLCSCEKLTESDKVQLVLGTNRISRCSPTLKKTPEHDTTQLLEALRHSQTRAREAEDGMKRACAEKEHVVRLVLRQASQIFAYKQWISLMQLENNFFQFKNSKSRARPTISRVRLPNWATVGNKKMRKRSWGQCWSRKRAKRARPVFDVGKYAIVFALGLGLVGVGLLLGSTIG
ncbi:Unknown protein [Striga hermonthica]|uniref:Transmembrane protein n=1 Tax=Striga hermonthica TaxID=68872 RepID=A0A9N7RPT5_STRHE|nr:Unknown protein [Striga hermonthica]